MAGGAKSLRENNVCDHLRNLSIHKSMGLNEMHLKSPEGIDYVVCQAKKSCQSENEKQSSAFLYLHSHIHCLELQLPPEQVIAGN